MYVNTSRPTRRWIRRLASLAIATAGLATSAAAIGPATPASASGGEQATEENPDGGPSFYVVEYAGVGNYDYIYENGLVRQYRNWTFVGQYSMFGDDDNNPR